MNHPDRETSREITPKTKPVPCSLPIRDRVYGNLYTAIPFVAATLLAIATKGGCEPVNPTIMPTPTATPSRTPIERLATPTPRKPEQRDVTILTPNSSLIDPNNIFYNNSRYTLGVNLKAARAWNTSPEIGIGVRPDEAVYVHVAEYFTYSQQERDRVDKEIIEALGRLRNEHNQKFGFIISNEYRIPMSISDIDAISRGNTEEINRTLDLNYLYILQATQMKNAGIPPAAYTTKQAQAFMLAYPIFRVLATPRDRT